MHKEPEQGAFSKVLDSRKHLVREYDWRRRPHKNPDSLLTSLP